MVSKTAQEARARAAGTAVYNPSTGKVDPISTPKVDLSTKDVKQDTSAGYQSPKVQYGDNASLPAVTKQKVAGQNITP